MARKVVLSMNNVAKCFYTQRETITILQDFSLTVYEGETVALMGASGSGKTTALAIAGGLDLLFDGDVECVGRCVKSLSSSEMNDLRMQNMGFVLQSPFLIQEFTASENVFMGRGDKKAGMKKAQELLESLEIGGLPADIKLSQMSPGQAQRVAIARALFSAPRLLICDEPTASLDSDNAARVVSSLKAYAQEKGAAVLLATHDCAVADSVDKRFALSHGRCERIA
ncbi:MAG: ABC transporter ATP-binding protein [Alphaproteobacteria bacterium]|nr:ABC transporter ATP-binding protein [Alphaproteobacteria bacterium]